MCFLIPSLRDKLLLFKNIGVFFLKNRFVDLNEGFATKLCDEFWERFDGFVSAVAHVNLQS